MKNLCEEAIGGNINKPPRSDGECFEYWKEKLQSFIISKDPKLWDLVEE